MTSLVESAIKYFGSKRVRYLATVRSSLFSQAFKVNHVFLVVSDTGTLCFVEIVTTSQSIDELNYFPNCDTLQARQPFGNYSVLLYLYFTVIIFLIRLLCVTYRFRTTLTKNKQQFETHGFGCVSQQNTL